jgi:predicted amidohydrolase
MSVALGMIENAAALGVELLVLPELWSCGYDPETLPHDARRDAEPRHGARSERLADAARRHELFLAAGSVPELGEDGCLHDTALVFDPRGELVAWHRKAHLFTPTLEHVVFARGRRLTTFEDAALGVVGLAVGFEGDFPEVARTLALRGARLVLAPAAYEVEGSPAWDVLHPALALTNSQWWVQANQAGSHQTSTLLGSSRIIAPTGTVVAAAGVALPGCASPAELLVHRIDLHLAHRREGIGALLEEGRQPALYSELVDPVPASAPAAR